MKRKTVIAKFSDLAVLSVARQFFTYTHSEDFNANISLLSKINKSMSTCASLANKSCITLSKSHVITGFYTQLLNYGIVYQTILLVNVMLIYSIPICSNMCLLLLYRLYFLACYYNYIIFFNVMCIHAVQYVCEFLAILLALAFIDPHKNKVYYYYYYAFKGSRTFIRQRKSSYFY